MIARREWLVRAAGPLALLALSGRAPLARAADASPSREAALPPLRVAALPPFEQLFRVHLGDWPRGMALGEARISLAIDAGGYRAGLREQAEGLFARLLPALVQSSQGRLGPAGFEPRRYAERRGKRPEQVVLFDADAGEIRHGDGRRLGDWREGVQDRLTVTLQLAAAARADAGQLAEGRVLELPVASPSSVSTMRFRSDGRQSLALPAGAQETLRLVRLSDDPDGERFELWLSAADGMPLRLRISDAKGRVLDQVHAG